MRDLLWQWVPWGIDAVVAVQRATGNALDPLFQAITSLGDQYALLLLLPALLWCLDKRRGLQMALLVLLSAYLNSALKYLFQIPRPFAVSPAVQPKVTAPGYAFPSGHAQVAATVWPTLARSFGPWWTILPAAALVLLISFSRVYLGVHYPQDVVAGMAVGTLLTLLYLRLQPSLEARLAELSIVLQVALAAALALVMILLLPTEEALQAAPVLVGLVAGHLLEERWIDFRPTPGALRSVERLALGLAVLAGVFWGLRALLPSEGVPELVGLLSALPYACVGLGATLLMPWLFVRLGLATAEAGCVLCRQRS